MNLTDVEISTALAFAGILAGTIIALLIVRAIALSSIAKVAKRTESRIDDVILASIRTPSVYWVVAVGFYVALGTSDVPQKYASYGLTAIYALIVFSVTVTAANIGSRLIQGALEKDRAESQATGLARTVITAIVYAIGLLVILNGLGISITPILTALGVGGLAVALALQDTLSNVFAGIHILADKPIRVGDFIKLNTGEQGYVVDVGWRTTRIKELTENVIIVPNSVITKSNITNYHMPDKRTVVSLKVSVGYGSDADLVERVLLEEAELAAGEVSGLLLDPRPVVRFSPGFGESSLDFTLNCHVDEYATTFIAQHELRKRILRRLRAEGIEMPFKTMTLHLENGQ